MDRRQLLQLLALSGAGAATAGGFGAPVRKRPPNIVVILSDDVGYGDVGCYGAKDVKTPRIDELAKDGLRFTNAHCDAATCTPSRYALLTGSYAWRRDGIQVLPGDAKLLIHPDQPTIASILKKAGYRTGLVGKTRNQASSSIWGVELLPCRGDERGVLEELDRGLGDERRRQQSHLVGARSRGRVAE